jgi:hypothetical protein
MVVERVLAAVGLAGAPVAVQVVVVTLLTGLGAKAGWLTVRRGPGALFAPRRYLRLALLLLVAAVAVIAGTARGLFSGDVGTQTLYALLLANLLEQLARLVVGE